MVAIAPPAHAQEMPVMDWITPLIESERFGNLRRNLGIDNNPRTQSNTVRKNGTATSDAQQPNFAYSPTPSLKQKIVQGYIDRLKTKNPAASQAIAANFGSGRYDYGQIYQGIIKGTGLRENDAADVQ